MDRFLDDVNIKKKKIKDSIQPLQEQAKVTLEHVKQQIDLLSDEEKAALVNNNFNVSEAAKAITDKLNIDTLDSSKRKVTRKKKNDNIQNISNESLDILEQNETLNIQEEFNEEPNIDKLETIKLEHEAISQEEQYNQAINEILNEQKGKSTIPQYVISRDKGKVMVETQAFKNIKEEKIGHMGLNKDILLEKYKEANINYETARIELEILSRMKNSVDKALQPTYDIKIKDQQKRIKEMELRASVITNLLEGR